MNVIIFILGGLFTVAMLYAGMRIEQSRRPKQTSYNITVTPEAYKSAAGVRGQNLWTKA